MADLPVWHWFACFGEIAPSPAHAEHVDAPLWYWIAFASFVASLLILDLGVFHRKARESTLRESGIWTAVWSILAFSFAGLIAWMYGSDAASKFITGYLIEWSLSMDNVFVFAVIFGYFRVPVKYQHRVLFWGILGAVIMRLIFILLGAAIIERYSWVLYILGVFLIYTGLHLAFKSDESIDPEKSFVLRAARKLLPVSKENHEQKFVVREHGKLCVTPLFLVLLVVESTDVAFAVDSVPAIFGITDDPFLVFTSNIFAILGLRALYFLLAGVMDLFRYLKYGLSAILVFVGLKMTVLEYFHWKLPHWASLLTVVGLLALSIIASLIAAAREQKAEEAKKSQLDSTP